jgi:Kef-type K+ transport system membrane component KefB
MSRLELSMLDISRRDERGAVPMGVVMALDVIGIAGVLVAMAAHRRGDSALTTVGVIVTVAAFAVGAFLLMTRARQNRQANASPAAPEAGNATSSADSVIQEQ